MLLALDISGFALIDKLYIEFENGLNIITGETGAGKSIVVDSINFIIGSKFSKDIIKKGMDKAEVRAIFNLSDKQKEYITSLGFECDDETIEIIRSINKSSKSVCRFNGKIVTLSGLKQITAILMEIHGQHENQILFDSANHISFLDAFCFKDDNSIKADFDHKFIQFKEFRNKILDDKMDEKTIATRLDTIKEQIKEFESLKWKEGEEEKLKEQTEKLENMEALNGAFSNSYDLLYGNEGCIFEQLKQVINSLEGIRHISDRYANICDSVFSVYYELEDIINSIRNEKKDFDFSPQKLEEMQKRLFEFSRFKKRFGGGEQDVLKYFNELKNEFDELEYKQANAVQLKKQLKALYDEAILSADELSKFRCKQGELLENAILAHLHDLGMDNARFKVSIERQKLGSKGIDKVEFLFCANKGQDLKPLNSVASGGEISRLMLSFKNVDLASSMSDAMVFDEVDTGISGKTAHAVAAKLANISKMNQVICVTHLPQVAAMGDVNIFVEKKENETDTIINAMRLDGNGKIHEVARLISGSDISESALMHASKLIDEGQKIKA